MLASIAARKQLRILQDAKIRISEQNTKGKLVFLCIFERKYLLAKRKDSANRTKNQIYLDFSEMQPLHRPHSPQCVE